MFIERKIQILEVFAPGHFFDKIEKSSPEPLIRHEWTVGLYFSTKAHHLQSDITEIPDVNEIHMISRYLDNILQRKFGDHDTSAKKIKSSDIDKSFSSDKMVSVSVLILAYCLQTG